MPGMAECIAACLDCADICLLDARLMSRNSPMHFDTCALCAQICTTCGDICERMAGSHSGQSATMMQECVEACRRCAQSCSAMASMRTAMH
ncbi:four-helix bundle copper-binding protein [Noviherbaspirillum malthae]|uniref:four-helix bundle copper-binding protein n=1 Tax=Noviherbaspirillum malthae TaxID=1260987 RepID=UPI002264643F|nr:four-helix bundle copper-binding protein [Noviherbaspirillum malthae]